MKRASAVSVKRNGKGITPSNGNGAASGRFAIVIAPDGTRTVTMPTGDVLTMQAVAPLILERLLNDQTGKPQVPIVEVKYPGGRRGMEPNPNDPDFQDSLKAWHSERHMRMMMGLIALGIRELPPAAFVEDMRDLFPDYGDKQMKYLWVASMLTNDSDIGDFAELITGQTLAVEGDISAAMDSFRS